MLEAISERLQKVFKTLRGEGHLTEQHVDAALAEIRRALLGADVALSVVKEFTTRVRERAIGKEVLGSLKPAQLVVKIVHEEMTRLLGGEHRPIKLKGFPSPILLVGLQGTGKTSTCAKLGLFIKTKLGKHVLLVPADTARPAAREQLEQLGAQVGLPVLDSRAWASAPEIARAALVEARRKGFEVLVFDTAGRLHVDEALMQELAELHATLQPSEVLLVADAMTGQDAVSAGGGVRRATAAHRRHSHQARRRCPRRRRPLGRLGERSGRCASPGSASALRIWSSSIPTAWPARILGMGDVLTLVEKAQESIDLKRAAELEKKIKKEGFDLEDLARSAQATARWRPPVAAYRSDPGREGAEGRRRGRPAVAALRGDHLLDDPAGAPPPEILNGSRRRRIARGAGASVEEVNRLLRQHAEMKKLMKRFGAGGDPRKVLRSLGL